MVYDSGRRELVLFGGFNGSDLDDTWVWDGVAWRQRSPAHHPPARDYHAMAYDEEHRVAVLFGGANAAALDDTWLWNGSDWQQAFPNAHPSARRAHKMTYDAERRQVVLFGGNVGGVQVGDTWIFDGTNWSQPAAQGNPPPTPPEPRDGHAMVYDSYDNVVLLNGGQNAGRLLSDTWVWNGVQWSRIVLDPSPPHHRTHAMGFDAGFATVVLFGGFAENGLATDTWLFGFDAGWGGMNPPHRPSGRQDPAMAYFPPLKQVVLFGGWSGGVDYRADTWTWDIPSSDWQSWDNAPPVILSDPFDLVAIAGAVTNLTVRASGPGPLTYQWFQSDQPIPGANGDTLSFSPLQYAHGGAYNVVVGDAFGSVTGAVASVSVERPAYLYWSTIGLEPGGSRIKRCFLDGQGVQTVASNPASARFAGIAIDPATGYLFTGDRGALWRMRLDGSERVTLGAPPAGEVTDVELDPVHKKLYWVEAFGDSSSAQVMRSDLDGNNRVPVAATPWCEGLALDPARGRIYFAASNSIWMKSLEGDTPATPIFNGLPDVFDVEMDANSGTLVWNVYNGGSIGNQPIQRASVVPEPGAPSLVLRPQEVTGNGLLLDTRDEHIYFSVGRLPNLAAPYRIQRMRPDGSDLVPVVSDPALINYIEVVHLAGDASPPTLLVPPLDTSVALGQPISLNVQAQGADSYRWLHNGTEIQGATAATLRIPQALLTDGGTYVVVVGNPWDHTTSAEAVVTVTPCGATPPGLIGWWRGEGNADDNVGGRHGTAEAGVTYVPGKVGQAFRFTGNNGFITLPGSYGGGSRFTIQCWVRSRVDTADFEAAVSPSEGPGFMHLQLSHSGSIGVYTSAGNLSLKSPSPLPLGQWRHLAVTLQSGDVRLYVDGQIADQRNDLFATFEASSKVRIGAGYNGARFFNGEIDEVAMWDRVLSAAEVQALYNAGGDGMCPPARGQPTVLVNGGQVTSSPLTVADPARIELHATYPGGSLRYTLDGSDPRNGIPYAGPLTQATPARLRAVALSAASEVLEEAMPVDLLFQPTPACVSPPGGLLGWWRAEGDARDAVGPRHGVVHGNVQFVQGKSGKAFRLDGTTGYISLPGSFGGTPENSIQCWFRPLKDTTDFEALISDTGAGFVHLQLSHLGNIAINTAAGNRTLPYLGPLPLGQWRHVVLTLKSGDERLYVDGVLVARAAFDFTSLAPTGNVRIGSGYAGGRFFGGDIDEVAIWNRALTPAEVSALFAAGGGGMCPPAPGSPAIFVDGAYEPGPTVQLSHLPQISLASSYPGGHLFYTLDDGDPRNGTGYIQPFQLDRTALIRAVAFSSDFSRGTDGDPVLLQLNVPPAITTQPSDATVLQGREGRVKAAASGAGPLHYQWWRENTPVPDATLPVLSWTSVQPAHQGNYRLVVTNVLGAATSSPALLTVVQRPGFTEQPQGVSLAAGRPLTLCATATGTEPLTYRWRLNGVDIPGATNTCLHVDAAQLADAGAYTVVVGNGAGALTSEPALVQVLLPALQGADLFANRVPLPTDSGALSATSSGATREAGEPLHAGKPGGSSIWYRWSPSAKGVATLSTRGSGFDTLLAVYTGTSVGSLAFVAADEDSGGFLTSLVRFPVEPGVDYGVAVDGLGGDAGAVALSWSLEATAIDLVPTVVTPPATTAARLGGDATFKVEARPAGVLYQWLFNGQPIAGATASTLLVSPVQVTDVGAYSVRLRSTDGHEVVSPAAGLELGPESSVVTYDKLQDLLSGPPPAPAPRLADTGPANGYIALGIGTRSSQILNNTNSSTQLGEPNHCNVIANGRSRWFGLRATTNGTIVLDTDGSSINTVMAVYRWVPDIRQVGANLVDCDIDVQRFGSRLVFRVTDAPRDFLVAVDSIGGARPIVDSLGRVLETGLIHLNWQMGLPPAAATVTGGGFATSGQPRLLHADAQGTDLHYQWFFNSSLKSGLQGSNWTLASVAPTNAGLYAVQVTNVFGGLAATTRLDVIEAPVRTAPVESGQAATFGIALAPADTTCPPQYAWALNGRPIPGATGPVLTVPVTSLAAAGTYTVGVGTCGSVSTFSAGSLAVKARIAFTAPALASLGPFVFPPVSDPVCALVLEESIGVPGSAAAWIPVLTNTVPDSPLELALPEDFRTHAGRVYRARLEACPP
jgi:hypothetical protein